jgi:hypothetical protein
MRATTRTLASAHRHDRTSARGQKAAPDHPALRGVKLLEQGYIPYDQPGRHRRILFSDLLAYQQGYCIPNVYITIAQWKKPCRVIATRALARGGRPGADAMAGS